MNNQIGVWVRAARWTVLMLTSLVIVSELYSPLKKLLADLSGHHWVSKGIVGVLFFMIIGMTVKRGLHKEMHREIVSLLYVSIVSSLLLFLFFTGHYYFG